MAFTNNVKLYYISGELFFEQHSVDAIQFKPNQTFHIYLFMRCLMI